MALGTPQVTFVNKVGIVCQALLALETEMTQINELYNGSPNWDDLFTDQEITDTPQLAAVGLTAQTLADAVYQVATIRNQVLTGNLPAVVLLAQLG